MRSRQGLEGVGGVIEVDGLVKVEAERAVVEQRGEAAEVSGARTGHHVGATRSLSGAAGGRGDASTLAECEDELFTGLTDEQREELRLLLIALRDTDAGCASPSGQPCEA